MTYSWYDPEEAALIAENCLFSIVCIEMHFVRQHYSSYSANFCFIALEFQSKGLTRCDDINRKDRNRTFGHVRPAKIQISLRIRAV